MREINLYNIQLMDLELFLTVAKYASFTKAGEKLFVTQSWVSKRIHLMEDELGLSLFIRNKREVTLTPAGRAYARGILRPVHEAEEAAMRRTLEEYSPDFLLAVEALTGHLYRTFRDHILKEKER